MTPRFSHADWFRAQLVVLSDRRPAPGAPRTGLQAAIEWALREHDGVWLVRHPDAEPEPEPEPHTGASGVEASGVQASDVEASEVQASDVEAFVLGEVPAQRRAAMDAWAGYVRANAAYAERIAESASPDGMVWINGHRWLLVAPALREHGHRGPIGLRLDVPFPAPARLEALPWHADLLAALCQLDLIELRSPECAARFEACLSRTGQRRPWIGVHQHDVDPEPRRDPAEWVVGFLQRLGSAGRRALRRELVG